MNNNISEKKNKENNNNDNGNKIQLSKAIDQNLSRKLQTSLGKVVRL